MSTYVMSDIHGESDRFHRMLELIHFSANDTLYIIGDVIDRGPDGVALLQEIMAAPNMILLLGNHEYIMLDYFSPTATEVEIRRWNRNGNQPTLAAWNGLTAEKQQEILTFLQNIPTHLSVTVNARTFYLVHGFIGDNVHDEVWLRPMPDWENPLPDCTLIIGHTKVSSLGRSQEEKEAYLAELELRGEHLHIRHLPHYIDIDCGCGYFDMPMRRLSCLRLDDMAEFYV